MSKALIVGSVALDTVETPHGAVKDALGGAASYGSVASSYFCHSALVGVVGQDFPPEHIQSFKDRGIDISSLTTEEGETFRWHGFYKHEMNAAFTNTTLLNVFETFNPVLTNEQKKTPFLFLANIHPKLQLHALDQMESPKFVAVDTMNFWIEGFKSDLTKVIKRVNLLLVNEGEARQYCETSNLVKAGRRLQELGPEYVVIKKGEHGCLIFQKESIYFVPAYPLQRLKDPTGAGDTFAGALVGYLARLGEVNAENLVRAVLVGSAMASFVVEDFSLQRLLTVTQGELRARVESLIRMVTLPVMDPATLEEHLALPR